MLYTVSEMAKRLGVAPSTLRYYDKEGLLPFIERSDGGIRMFKDTDFEWLSIIECLKKTGMPIKEMKVFIDWCIEGDTTISKRKELIEKSSDRLFYFKFNSSKKLFPCWTTKNGIMKLRKKQAHVKYMKQCRKMMFPTIYEKQENGQKVFLPKI